MHWTSQKDRRVLALGGTLIALILILGRGMPLWRVWEVDKRASATGILRRAAEFDRTTKEYLATAANAAESQRRYGSSLSGVLRAMSPVAAAATLASLTEDVAEKAGAKLTSIQLRPDSAFHDHFARVGVRFSASADVEGLTALLEGLETNATLLAIRELSVTPAEVAGSDAKPEVLRFQVLVEALAFDGTYARPAAGHTK